jgi:hypothetical protein
MKMPSINIAFKEKGISAIERSERGIVLLILKEETLPSQTEVNLYTADDIPKELSDSNREQLELTLRGYVNSPKKVIAEIISKDAEDYTDVLKTIENKRFDYLVIPDIEENHIDTIATWIKGMRTNKNKRIKAVLPTARRIRKESSTSSIKSSARKRRPTRRPSTAGASRASSQERR